MKRLTDAAVTATVYMFAIIVCLPALALLSLGVK